MFWSFWQFEKSSRVQTGTPRLILEGLGFFVLLFFWCQVTHTDPHPGTLRKVFPHHIITHKEFGVHLCKVAAQREAGIGSTPPKEKVDKWDGEAADNLCLNLDLDSDEKNLKYIVQKSW